MSKLLLKNIGMLATPLGTAAKKGAEQGQIQILKDAWVLVEDGIIAQVGTGAAPAVEDAQVLDAGGNLVTPGLVDAHTHLIFGGWRQNELGMKLHGKTYLEIQNAGGGIQSTTNATRQATEEELTQKAAKALDEMMGFGTTTVEAKSGYGLATEHELKALQVQVMIAHIETPAPRTHHRIGTQTTAPGMNHISTKGSAMSATLPSASSGFVSDSRTDWRICSHQDSVLRPDNGSTKDSIIATMTSAPSVTP